MKIHKYMEIKECIVQSIDQRKKNQRKIKKFLETNKME